MSAGDDFYFTGGGFSDWSGGSAGNFGSSSSSGGASYKGGGSAGSGNKKNDNLEPGPNDWMYGCGCLMVIAAAIAAGVWWLW